MNLEQLANNISHEFGITTWEARSRVEFNVSELEINADELATDHIEKITRCIAADLKASK